MSSAASSVVLYKVIMGRAFVPTKHTTYHIFAVIGIRKTGTDGLINIEHICIGSPRIRVVFWFNRFQSRAWTMFHEQTHARRVTGTCVQIFQQPVSCRQLGLTAIGPKNDVVLVGIVAALKEVEEQVSRLDVDVTCVGTRQNVSLENNTERRTNV